MKKILYIAPDIRVMGGISSVIKSCLSTELPKRHNIILIASHKDGTKFIKLIQAITGLIKTFFYLITKKIDIVHIHAGDIISCKRKFSIFMERLFLISILTHHKFCKNGSNICLRRLIWLSACQTAGRILFFP